MENYRVSDLELVLQTKYDIPEIKNENGEYAGAFTIAEKPVVLFRVYSRAENVHYTYAQLFSNDLKAIGEPRQLTSYKHDKKNEPDKIGVVLSADGQTVVAYSANRVNSDSYAEIAMWAFDTKLEPVWDNVISLPINQQAFELHEFLPIDKNRLRILVSQRLEGLGELKVKGGYASRYVLLEYDARKHSIHELELNLGQKWIYSAGMEVRDSTSLQIAGFYSDLTELFVSGTFSLSFNLENGEIIEQGLKAFDHEFEGQFGERKEDRGRIMNQLKPGAILFPGNGNSFLTAERRYTKTISTFNPTTGFQSVFYEYRREEMLLTEVMPDGKTKWALRLPKYQSVSSANCRFCGYAPMWNDSLRIVVYNDHYDNDKYSWDNSRDLRTLEYSDQANAFAAVVHPDGSVEKYEFFDSHDNQRVIHPKIHLKLDMGAGIFYSEGPDAFSFVKLEWELMNPPE